MTRTAILRLALASSLVSLLAALLLSAPQSRPVTASRLAGIKAAGASGIQVVNLDSSNVNTVTAQFFRQGGGPAVPINLPPIAPGGAYNIYLPSEARLSNGAYAVVVTGDHALSAVARTEWPASGGVTLYDAPGSGTDVVAPTGVGDADEHGIVNIQNTDTAAQATVTVALTAAGASQPAITHNYSIDSGSSITLDLENNPDFEALPAGFVGVARVTSATAVAVMTIVDHENSAMGVYALSGVPVASAATTVRLPMVRAASAPAGRPAEAHDSRIFVLNPSASSADVTVSYRGSAGACAGQTVQHGGQAFAVPAGSSVIFDAGAGDATLATGASGLPAGCDAAATVTSSVPVAAMAVDRLKDVATDQLLTASGTNGFAPADGAHKVLLPLFRREHTAMKLSTDISVMNAGDAAASVSLSVLLASGEVPSCGAPCQLTLAPGEGHTWRAEDTGAPAGRYGSATVTADQPVVVTVDDQSRLSGFDAGGYEGIPADAPQPDSAREATLPLVLRGGGGGGGGNPTPVVTGEPPVGDVQLSLIGFVDVAGGSDPNCAGCNGVFEQGDADYAVTNAFGAFTVEVRDNAGVLLASAQSAELAAGIQRHLFTLPAPTGNAAFHVTVAQDPSGWHPCTLEQRSRVITAADFHLNNARLEWHFTDQTCEPLTPVPTLPPTAVPTMVPGSQPPPPKMIGASGLQIANLSSAAPAQVSVDFVGPAGGAPGHVELPPIAPEQTYNVYLPTQAQFPNGAYAATLSSNVAIGALCRTEWSATGSAVMVEDAVPASDVVVPLVAKGGPGSRNTIVSVQNFDGSAPTDVTLTVLDQAGATAATVTRGVPVGAALSVDLGRDPGFTALPLGFVGSLRARAATRIAVSAIVDVEHSLLAAYAFNGAPAVAAAETLFVPRAQASVLIDPLQAAAGVQRTRIGVTNPS